MIIQIFVDALLGNDSEKSAKLIDRANKMLGVVSDRAKENNKVPAGLGGGKGGDESLSRLYDSFSESKEIVDTKTKNSSKKNAKKQRSKK